MTTRDSYSGLSAASYDLWFGGDDFEDVELFREAIREGGEPALEIGCGTGRLLVPFALEGFDVEGLDRSGEMLDQCCRKADALGLSLVLHQADMVEFELERRYRTIYVPFGSFMLVGGLKGARRALRCFRSHLESGGRAIIPLHLPWRHDVGVEPAKPGEWRLRRIATREDEAVVKCFENVDFDFDRQLQHVRLRFEIVEAGQVTAAQESEQVLRWFMQEEFAGLLREAGFSRIAARKGYTREPADAEDASFTFIASWGATKERNKRRRG